eukprot:CAMPEP_0113844972 /NCGR_PEP_ID=MMETSP0372-20130328/511_1 /TAXON_ID=340204 /ORGANISM="Lankesteria abbotti" /LENGTH=358 /DNA_ID=CAMNT_0000813989 /DNA_START=528 /DNA_END=1604 /DNA_ORIENTATION=+ /assembly_acc=CAM_ASM_000359
MEVENVSGESLRHSSQRVQGSLSSRKVLQLEYTEYDREGFIVKDDVLSLPLSSPRKMEYLPKDHEDYVTVGYVNVNRGLTQYDTPEDYAKFPSQDGLTIPIFTKSISPGKYHISTTKRLPIVALDLENSRAPAEEDFLKKGHVLTNGIFSIRCVGEWNTRYVLKTSDHRNFQCKEVSPTKVFPKDYSAYAVKAVVPSASATGETYFRIAQTASHAEGMFFIPGGYEDMLQVGYFKVRNIKQNPARLNENTDKQTTATPSLRITSSNLRPFYFSPGAECIFQDNQWNCGGGYCENVRSPLHFELPSIPNGISLPAPTPGFVRRLFARFKKTKPLPTGLILCGQKFQNPSLMWSPQDVGI